MPRRVRKAWRRKRGTCFDVLVFSLPFFSTDNASSKREALLEQLQSKVSKIKNNSNEIAISKDQVIDELNVILKKNKKKYNNNDKNNNNNTFFMIKHK